MSRFFWLIRREIWEHKAIWVAPLIVLACLLLAVITGNVHLGPFGATDASTPERATTYRLRGARRDVSRSRANRRGRLCLRAFHARGGGRFRRRNRAREVAPRAGHRHHRLSLNQLRARRRVPNG